MSRTRPRSAAVLWLATAALIFAGPLFSGGKTHREETPDIDPPRRNYFAYVCAESEDEVALIQFGPDGTSIVETIEVGSFPAEIEGPHGINVSPDGQHWYVSIAHGQPFGSIHKFTTSSNDWQELASVGMFPATLDISPATNLLFVVNSDFYGDHQPSTISVIETDTMTEVEQIPTGAMPHGARLDPTGRLLYSVNMMNDDLVEIDALGFEIRRRLALGVGSTENATANHDHTAHQQHSDAPNPIEPSWVSKPTGNKLYVTALSADQVLEVDLETWTVARRFDTAKGPYNLSISPNRKLMVVTYKKSDAVGFWDLEGGRELARIKTQRRIPHGVVITSDGRYSIVTVEGVGGEPGTVEIFDNTALERVDQIDIGKQAGGIALWEGPITR